MSKFDFDNHGSQTLTTINTDCYESIFVQASEFDIGAISICQILQVKGIKNGCPCIVEIRGTQGCALVGDPARAVGECRDVAKAQP